jgi:hypothetical protein
MCRQLIGKEVVAACLEELTRSSEGLKKIRVGMTVVTVEHWTPYLRDAEREGPILRFVRGLCGCQSQFLIYNKMRMRMLTVV